MGKMMKKGKSGEAIEFTTRKKALKRLQVSWEDFRKLCILKGIYPRDPKHKNKVHHTPDDNIFYHLKDIRFLGHEPLLSKFRAIKAFEKKVNRLKGRGELSRLKNIRAPGYDLAHLVKERYPRFIDALRDLDDALTLIAMFAALPLTDIKDHKEAMISKCATLLNEFKRYAQITGSLTKSFISIKGIYYQVEIMGQPIVWIEPHQFTNTIPEDVDIQVMLIFLEFYLVLLGFVNFKLYKRIGRNNEGDEQQQEQDKDAMCDDSIINRRTLALFKDFTFFLGREVHFSSLNMIIKSLGGSVLTDMEEESNTSITHQIVDRPSIANMYLDRMYLQPQWVFDCLNAGSVLPADGYRIGEELPVHQCPFQAESAITIEEENTLLEEMILPPKTEEENLKRESKEAAVSMLPKRKRKLYISMQNIRRKKAEGIHKLRLKKEKKMDEN